MDKTSLKPNTRPAARVVELPPLDVILHRGQHEIGGNLFEIRHTRGARLFLDLGLPLFSFGTQNPLNLDFARLARKPVEGLAQLRQMGIPPEGLGLFIDEEQRPCAGIFISHAHLDHWGLLPLCILASKSCVLSRPNA